MTMALPILDTTAQRPSYANGPRDLESVRLLRISVTDRCMFRCVYCMPDEGMTFAGRDEVLSAGDILRVAEAARSAGVDHFKLTGGEPTARNDLLDIVRGLVALGPTDLSMTTNSVLLPKLAEPLREAGLDRLTVSLDTLKPERFKRIAGQSHRYTLDDVWRGIDAAVAAGFERLKLNCVVMGGVNDDEAAAIAALTMDRPWTVRFIEYMPLGDAALLSRGLAMAEAFTVDNAAVLAKIEAVHGKMEPVVQSNEVGVGPARIGRLPGAHGRIGFISAMSRPFCETCNRLRLTATGELRACLFDGGEVSLLDSLRRGAGQEQLVALMRQCVVEKPEVHSARGNRAMSQMGG